MLAAKNLIGANLNGTSDPYAIITCASQKRFSSMVPGSRNPMWGEEFNFSLPQLPVNVLTYLLNYYNYYYYSSSPRIHGYLVGWLNRLMSQYMTGILYGKAQFLVQSQFPLKLKVKLVQYGIH